MPIFTWWKPGWRVWLLTTRDEAGSEEFYLAQEFMAYMLGVRRVGVTRAARALRTRRLVSYSRGNISLLDVHGQERASCSCYGSAMLTSASCAETASLHVLRGECAESRPTLCRN